MRYIGSQYQTMMEVHCAYTVPTLCQTQGAIILGIGGDSSDWAIGTFYEVRT